MPLSDYDYHLPPELIAQQPTPNRTDSRLLVVNRQAQTLEHMHISDLPSLLKAEDVLVINNTKVLPVKLFGYRLETGGKWEGIIVRFVKHRLWQVICKTKRSMRTGEIIVLQSPDTLPSDKKAGLLLELISKQEDGSWFIKPLTKEPLATVLKKTGWVPLPPYIRKGKMSPEDAQRYQTVYASEPGAIAAPTAGLHFTPQLFDEIKQIGTAVVPVTLHVGIGTFKPITAENIEEHRMHTEWCSLSKETAETILSRKTGGGRIIAVGTTSVRVLESASAKGTLQEYEGETSLFIRPPYFFRNVDVLLTNFHFPKSTLLMLVRTFGGDELIKAAYEEAIREKYRFFSYGDAMLIL
ncbi:MAG: tRNA preQ1(34) S-adenosylmethionine ribosyltransferase-isomerase QueA [Planctomycetaceae bacterium]|nr:tRNA preQ1(34) S-adenosylmethionine ribosyltransferase-isomerase QueA [Planctomycetaceae bacterium]